MPPKKTLKNQVMDNQQQDNEESIDCACEILLDTSLSDVGDSDCTCSDCLQANLYAFNELEETGWAYRAHQQRENRASTKNKAHAPYQYGQNSKSRQQRRQDSYKKFAQDNQETVKQQNRRRKQISKQKQRDRQQSEQDRVQPKGLEQYSREGIEDYMKITKYRTRKYLEQRDRLRKDEKVERDNLKARIKQNLLMLEEAAKQIRAKDMKETAPPREKYKWNHSPFAQVRDPRKDREYSHKQYLKSPLDTNLNKLLDQHFDQKRDQILDQIRKEKQRSLKEVHNECEDRCDNHHGRTSPSKIKQIQQLIQANVAKHKKQEMKHSQKYQEIALIQRAKLRAIDLKCKDIVKKSKKYQINGQRSSFHLSADHFSTFSELKQTHVAKLLDKKMLNEDDNINVILQQKKMKTEQEIKVGNKNPTPVLRIEHYQQAEQRKKPKGAKGNIERQQQYCQRIVHDAKIKSPKMLKQTDKESREKMVQSKYSQASNQPVLRVQTELKRQMQQKKQLQQQIQRKKQELLEEYKKRRRDDRPIEAKNKKLKEEYENNLKRKMVQLGNKNLKM